MSGCCERSGTTTRKRIAVAAAVLVTLLAVAFLAVVRGGVVDVGVTAPHSAPVRALLRTTMESSIRNHAGAVVVPSGIDLKDPALAEKAFGHYSVACATCHGSPGTGVAPWMVTEPPSPPLAERAGSWSDAELYWIIKNGIKMTGMPALGPTHQDSDLWAIAAFVRQLPTMSPEAYQHMAERHAAKAHASH